MLLTCLSTESASSSTISLHLSAFAWARAPFCMYCRLSLAASGFWNPIVHLKPDLTTGFGYVAAALPSRPLYPGIAATAATDARSSAPVPTSVSASLDLFLTCPSLGCLPPSSEVGLIKYTVGAE